jgi:hypothetical protein
MNDIVTINIDGHLFMHRIRGNEVSVKYLPEYISGDLNTYFDDDSFNLRFIDNKNKVINNIFRYYTFTFKVKDLSDNIINNPYFLAYVKIASINKFYLIGSKKILMCKTIDRFKRIFKNKISFNELLRDGKLNSKKLEETLYKGLNKISYRGGVISHYFENGNLIVVTKDIIFKIYNLNFYVTKIELNDDVLYVNDEIFDYDISRNLTN